MGPYPVRVDPMELEAELGTQTPRLAQAYYVDLRSSDCGPHRLA